ncbi:MAG: molybdopterin-dependent oxidoreductase [Myxococcota bacterium]
MASETHKTYCRICTACCALEARVENGRLVHVRGDANDPVSGGYTCVKGRQLPHQVHGPERLRGSLVRGDDGVQRGISTARALDEIAATLQRIIAERGARAVATYSGTAAYANSAALPVIQAWHAGIGSTSNYSSMTIDQPAKIIAVGRQGVWGGGHHTFASSDVVLSVGNNPIVSGLTLPGGVPGVNPVRQLEQAKKRGLTLICIDPRRTELAKRADLHLQVRPGEDPTLLAGMLRVILEEERHDVDFCRDHVAGIEELRAAVADFTPDYVEARSGVPSEQGLRAARLFAAGPRGCASSGTGPDMAPRACLTEHLLSTLNAVCGRYNREGDPLPNPGVLSAKLPRPAQTIAPELLPSFFQFGTGPACRFRGLARLCDEMPTATLAEEILEPGDGQIRALICVGGNPAMALPDQRNLWKALASLEILVCVDIAHTETTRMAHYAIAARHPLERDDVTEFMDMFYEVPYAHYAPAILEPDFDAIEDWEVFTGLAKRLKTSIELPGGAIDVAKGPSKFEVLELIRPDTRIPLAEIRDRDGGHIFDEIDVTVAPPIPGLDARLDLAPPGICDELREVRAESFSPIGQGPFPYRLISRRMRHVANSVGRDFPETCKRGVRNPAYMNPADLEKLGVEAGNLVEIATAHAAVRAVVEPSDEVQSGVISMAHCFGGGPDEDGDARAVGSSTSRLVAVDRDYDPITGMAPQSAIPVAVRPARA